MKKENSSKKKLGFKSLALIIAIAAVVAVVSVGAVAWLMSEKSISNTFTPAEVDSEVIEKIEDDCKTTVKIQNVGNTDAYIRVAVIGNTIDEDGNITGVLNLSEYLAAEGWITGGDGFYYWPNIVSPKGTADDKDLTGELLKKAIPLTGNQVTILADAIQAKGVDQATGEMPVVQAWGVTVKDGVITGKASN